MIGRFARSKAGHDKDTFYVIVAQEGEFVYLSDGRLKPPDKPKKKRIRHVQPIACAVQEELLGRLQRGERVYPEEIKYALKQYCDGKAISR